MRWRFEEEMFGRNLTNLESKSQVESFQCLSESLECNVSLWFDSCQMAYTVQYM